ncbi:fluoride efflux transporter CrcB [Fibrella forsythiae]|uniref:Fluoride-specific ion channel FluC n=1 Tax=Fibrella forsythiae TaxID=2817061 RepID=A0ABS3JLA1_9BACT|nr:fluoride efflux transporter CrcB [Fibrella forsythiae]MBO0950218.1 fluoride efflux transporter CrcB [Fibrella forsythiae]
MNQYVLVFLGGGLGSMLRFSLGKVIPITWLGTSFPASILTVNVLASVVLGAVMGWVAGRPEAEPWRLLLGVGICGGLSTFSSFSQDNLMLLQQGRAGAALLNIALNVFGCLLASTGGWWLTTK